MRYSFMAVAIASTLALAACNQTTSNNESDKSDTTNEAATAAPSNAAASGDASASANESASMNITGAGASFPQPIYAKWSDAYNKATGGQVNYQSIGSSGGIKQIVAKTVDFGASDAPMTPEE